MNYINLTNPGQPAIDGDRVKYLRRNGATEEKVWRTSVAPPVMKNIYSAAQFYEALTVPERELLINKARSTDAAGAIYDKIKLLGLDFNDPDDVSIIGQMVDVGVLISDRRDELIG